MVTAVAVLFLIATVVFALSQMLNVSSGNVIDGQRQGDSTAAFFLAESGLEKAQASLATALNGSVTNTSCTGIGTSFNLGLGSVVTTAVSTPATCDNSGATPCTTCGVTSTAQVGVTKRTVTQDMALTVKNGVTCATNCGNNPVTWQLKLKNNTGVDAVGIFNLAYQQQGNNSATCAAGSNCRLQLDVAFGNNGVSSISLQGNAVLITAGATYPIYQLMNKGGNGLAEVGVFLTGTSAPTLTGPTTSPGAASYWSGTTKAGNIATAGSTNDGTFTSTGTCSAPSANAQACTSWCYGGDTLVFSVASLVTALTDEIGTVRFGTNANNVAMTRVAKFPTPTVVGAPTDVDAEIWYARNPNLSAATGSPSPLAVNASSYKGRGTGAVGAAWTTSNINANETTVTTSGITGNGALIIGSTTTPYAWPAQLILPGDTITSTSGAVTITATIGTQSASVEAGTLFTGQGGRGTYNLSNIKNNGTLVTTSGTTFNGTSRLWTVNSNVLNVTACTLCFFAQGDAVALALTTGRTINAVQTTPAATFGRTEVAGGLGRYPISGTATRVASATSLYAGTPGPTLYLPSASIATPVWSPTANALTMMLAVKSGTGAFTSGTIVSAAPTTPNTATTAFALNATPSTALDLATICAGTCALFVPNGTTNFALAPAAGVPPANFASWNGGFTCLKGVDLTPQVVTSSSTASRRWTEVVY